MDRETSLLLNRVYLQVLCCGCCGRFGGAAASAQTGINRLRGRPTAETVRALQASLPRSHSQLLGWACPMGHAICTTISCCCQNGWRNPSQPRAASRQHRQRQESGRHTRHRAPVRRCLPGPSQVQRIVILLWPPTTGTTVVTHTTPWGDGAYAAPLRHTPTPFHAAPPCPAICVGGLSFVLHTCAGDTTSQWSSSHRQRPGRGHTVHTVHVIPAL